MTINCGGTLINLKTPKVMGILNLTPDSFFDGGKLKDDRSILSQATKMLDDGAAILDLGGYSSRPGAQDVSPSEEASRVVPVVKLLRKEFKDVVLSVDSFRASVIQQALDTGASLVNDITGGYGDPKMLETVAQYQVPYIIMHMRGTPQTMMQLNEYEDLIVDMNAYFSERIAAARALGINDLIIDPGVGFAKNITQNFTLMSHLDLLLKGTPMLVGLSRKSFIYKTLGIEPQDAGNGTTAMHMVALQQGANILRVHDVKEAVECCNLFVAMQNAST